MRTLLNRFCLIQVLLFLFQKGITQIIISGPTCAVPGTVYQYTISGNWDSASSVKVCLTAGALSSYNDSSCTAFLHSINRVLVVWNNSESGLGIVNVTSSLGNASLTVHFTQTLQSGSIDSICKVQVIDSSTVPIAITCGVDSGGSCSPSYAHQWQSSSDMITWVDIPSATGVSLNIRTTLNQSRFYRRKVTELSSGSIGYSDAASVLVVLPHADTTSHSDNLAIQYINGIKTERDGIKSTSMIGINVSGLPEKDNWIKQKDSREFHSTL